MRSTTTNRSRFRHHYRKTLRSILFCFALAIGSQTLFAQTSSTDPLVRFHTDLGDIDVVLLQSVAPNNVANFLGYVNPAIYDNSIVHRSVQVVATPNNPAFSIIQGGGYTFVNNQVTQLPVHSAVVNEFHVSNKRGTLAMAKLPNDPNSATNQWFFNGSDDNASNLDTQNGGFTVFGRIITTAGLTTMDTIGAVPIFNVGTGFENLPLRNYTGGNLQNANFVHIIWIKVVPQITALTRIAANTMHINVHGAASKTYQLQSSASPAASGFTNLTTVTTNTNGNVFFNDTSAGTTKFYRLTIP